MSTIYMVASVLFGIGMAALYIAVMCMAVILEGQNEVEIAEVQKARVLRQVNEQETKSRKYRKI
jgi:hypothetical protein